MLSKPGEARKTAAPSQRRRKVVEENSDDVVRRLQRLPPNKACADCSSKLTQCVNLTHGTYVCMACSGVHREFNHKIKGIGHSSFTPEEVSRLRHPSCGNESINAHYLAKYNVNIDRMKAPKNNNDLKHLRSWIRKKYIDKKWCEVEKDDSKDSGAGGGRSGVASGTTKSSSGSRSSKKSETSRRKIMPKVNNEPSSKPSPAPAAPVHDPFGFDSIAPSAAPVAANDTSWDAFGGPTQNNSNAPAFSADFGTMNGSSAPPPAAAPPAPVAPPPAFQPNFGNFPQQQGQQPTMASLPPTQTQQQPAFQANFGQAPVANQAPAVQQPPQQVQQQVQGFASFAPMQQQLQNGQNNQQGFANFSSVQQQQQNQFPQQQTQGGASMMGNQPPQQQPTQNNAHMQQQGAGMMEQHGNSNNFGQFPQQQPPQQQMQQNLQNDPSGFANFSSVPPATQTQPSNDIQMQQAQQQNHMQPLANGNTPQLNSQQPSMAQPLPPQPSQNNGKMQSGGLSNEQPMATNSEVQHQPSSAPSSQLLNNESEHSGTAMNPNAFQSVDNEKKSAFDAFDGLSLEPTPTSTMVKTPNSAQYHEGQQVFYSNIDGSCLVTITKVHYDDALHPFYTVNLGGREKQTDDAHLSLPNGGSMQQNSVVQGQINDNNGSALVLQETACMLQKLNSQQLMQVQQFIASLVSSGNNHQASTPSSSGQNTQINSANQQQQQQQHMSFGSIDSTSANTMDMTPPPPYQSAPQPPAAQFSMQHQQQNQSNNHGMTQAQQPMGMAMNAPAAGAAPTPPSAMPPPPPPPAQVPTPTQFSMQQHLNQGMGMGTMNHVASPSPPGQAPVAMGQFSMQQQQPNNGTTSNNAPALPPAAPAPAVVAPPAPATLPPVEKEGNPFDFY